MKPKIVCTSVMKSHRFIFGIQFELKTEISHCYSPLTKRFFILQVATNRYNFCLVFFQNTTRTIAETKHWNKHKCNEQKQLVHFVYQKTTFLKNVGGHSCTRYQFCTGNQTSIKFTTVASSGDHTGVGTGRVEKAEHWPFARAVK